MKKLIVSLCFLLLTSTFSFSQSATWQQTATTPTFPNSLGNLCLAIDEATDAIYVGTYTGVYKSSDQGATWERSLIISAPVFHISIHNQHIYAVSSLSDFYHSANAGASWTKSGMPSSTQPTALLTLHNGNILVATGEVVTYNDTEELYRGTGIMRSADHGATWQILTPESMNRYISHMATDSQGRIYASTHEYNGKDGNLYFSQNNGDQWQALPAISLQDEASNNPLQVHISYITNLFVSNTDVLHVSFRGYYQNLPISVNLTNTFSNALASTPWQHVSVTPFTVWQYPVFRNMFIDRNGRMFANRESGSPNSGSIFYSTNNGVNFLRVPLTTVQSETGPFEAVCFAQTSSGRVYVIQRLDHRVYFADTFPNVPTRLPHQNETQAVIQVYPNPATDAIALNYRGKAPEKLTVIDATGKMVAHVQVNNIESGSPLQLPALKTGMYMLLIEKDATIHKEKLIIR